MHTHTPPTTPRIHPTIRRSYEGRACPCEGRGTSLPEKGESRGGHPSGKGSGGCAPSYEKNLRGRAGGPNQRRNADPKSPPGGCRCTRCPALFPFVDFGPFFTETHAPRSARALADTTLFPFFDRFNTPQRGPRPLIRPVPGRYDLSPFVDLSIAPQSQAAPRPSRHRPDGKLRAHHSAQIKSSRGGRGDVRGWGGPGPARLPG